MGRPPKSLVVIETEGKSHRTKAEKAARKQGEDGLTTGKALCEWKSVRKNETAHAEFKRLVRLLKAIEKNDAIYANVINRYCLLYAECLHYEALRDKFEEGIDKLQEDYENGTFDIGEDETAMSAAAYYKLLQQMRESITKLDKNLLDKRKMMLDIEKESAMTIASALRAIPKKPQEEKDDDPMAGLLNARRG